MSKNNTSHASNPAQLPFSFSQYCKCYSIMLAVPLVVLLGVPVIAVVKGFQLLSAVIIGVLVALAGVQTVISNAKQRWQNGNLCAALVVSESPYTIAVLTDLCNDGSTPRLAVKIRRVPLQNMAGGPPKNGAKLAAVSQYIGATDTGAWQDFTPMIANCGCKDLNQIKRAMNSIDANDWQILSQAMKSLKPTDLGLHHLQV